MNNLTLTRRMRHMLDQIPTEWKNLGNCSPTDSTLVSLEKRGLIEVRLDPKASPEMATFNTLMRIYDHWQVRRVS